ncbi:MAG: tetratricopeptide repeat protein [bacterium]|nr:tetratricopeptide repeat protein [bacterium]
MKARVRSIAVLFLICFTVLLTAGLLVTPATYSASPDRATTLYLEGKALQDQGDYEGAIQRYEKAVREKRDYADAYFAMGVAYYKWNRPAEAIKTFKEVLRLNPASSETYNNLAVIYAQQGDYENAAKQLKETIRLDPGYQQGRLNLADLYLAQSIQEYLNVIRSKDGETTQVREKLRRLLKSDAQNPEFQYHLGVLNRIEGNQNEAIKNLRNTVRLDPGYANRVYLELGEYLEESGKPEDALKEYGRLLDKDPKHYWAAFASGRIKNDLKDYAAAKTFLTNARAANSTPEVNYELGRAWEGLDRLDEAIASYRTSVQQKENPETRFRIAQAFRQKKEYTEALKEFETILNTHPDKALIQKEIREVTKIRLEEATPAGTTVVAKAEQAAARPIDTAPAQAVISAETIPASLVGLEREGDSALVVDKASQALLLYRNISNRIEHVKTFACSTGENNGQKLRMGDKRTPEGVYVFTEIKHDEELLPEYGKMAFPMDYPNLMDRRSDKNGNGIWLHSTNEPLRSYLPQKTRGCVVVNDTDIAELADAIKLNDTPIVIHHQVSYVGRDAQKRQRQKILDLVRGWEESWERKDLNQFIGFYSASFTNGDMDIQGWEQYKRGVFRRAKTIRVDLTPYQIINHDNYAVVTFLQQYRSGTYSDTGIKRLFLMQENNAWRIVGEEWHSA